MKDADPSFRRATGIAAVTLAATYLVFSLVFSSLAPMGDWKNQIFGLPVWGEWDPGGAYVDAAHQLAWGEGQLFEGHPGTGLILLLSGLQHAHFTISGTGTSFSFTEFTARNLPSVFVLSKLMMTVLHLAACFATFLLAKRTLRDERAAVFAAFGYATSLNVGYYLSRISVEPLVVICFVFSLLAIWRYQDRASEDRLAAALRAAAVAAIFAVTGVTMKLNFLAPLVPFLAVYVLLGGWGERYERSIPWRTRTLGLLVFGGTSAVAGLLYSQFIDWESFFRLWSLFSVGEAPVWSLSKLLPGFTPARVFPLCESVYLLLGGIGWVAFLRRYPELRMRALWLSAYGFWGLLLFAYRISGMATFFAFHYFHLTNVVVAVFFGYSVLLMLRRFRVPESGWQPACLGMLMIFVIHWATFWTVIDSRRADMALYEPNRELHHVIAKLEPGQKLGCIGCRPRPPQDRSGGFPIYYPISSVGWTTGMNPHARSRLADEFASLFVPMKATPLGSGTKWVHVAALGATIFVLDDPPMTTRPAGVEQPGKETR